MAADTGDWLLPQLERAESYEEQIATLRRLKNEIVGHVQKKEEWVRRGALQPLVSLMSIDRTPSTGSAQASDPAGLELVRKQALELFSVFASGGPAFLSPLHASGVLPATLSCLQPSTNHPRVVLSALKAINNIAQTAQAADSAGPLNLGALSDALFSQSAGHVDSLHDIILSLPPSLSSQHTNAAVLLIATLCREERHQAQLARAGILHALATRLASFVVARGQVVPGAEGYARNEGLMEAIPEPAAADADLAVVLEAIAAVIGESRWRAAMLIYSPSLLAVFPNAPFETPNGDLRGTWGCLASLGIGGQVPQELGAMDYLLPAVTSPYSRPSPANAMTQQNLAYIFSGSGASSSAHHAPRSLDRLSSSGIGDDDYESPLIPWLISLARSGNTQGSLMAASVLTSLYKLGQTGPWRESAMSTLVVNLLMEMVFDFYACDEAGSDMSKTNYSFLGAGGCLERALLTLARLITDSESLQKAAFDNKAVQTMCKILKESYEPVRNTNQRLWNPVPTAERSSGDQAFSPDRTMGAQGQHARLNHKIRLREASLKVIAALISFKDEYRRALVEQEVILHVVESLVPVPSKPARNDDRSKSNNAADASASSPTGSLYGNNPPTVLIAACHTVRMLTRSVGILRTTLEDAGLAIPIMRLLKHPDVEVQIAAAAACCNLVTEVSPMRDRLADLGIMKVLCEQARSTNASLRLNAIWALKHFVQGATSDVKKACMEELEPGWLIQLICNDAEDNAAYATARKRAERQASGASGDDMDEDIDMEQGTVDNARNWFTSSLQKSTHPLVSHERSRTGRLRFAELRVESLRENEQNAMRKARSLDLAIQEQALNFIRNLISPHSGAGANSNSIQDTTEMIDYLFSELGQDRLFDILASKLRPKILRPFSRRADSSSSGTPTATSGASRRLPPQARIVEVVVYVLVHMAASVPRHRQVVISQTELLRTLEANFGNKDKGVRVALCHLVSNLVWRDDNADGSAAIQRAQELKRLGLLQRLEALEQDDGELDVRERAKSAIYQLNKQACATS